MLLKSKLNDIKTILKSDNVLANLEERYCYAKDASNINRENSIPDLVVFVETIEQVQKVLSYANQHKIPVIARGAGTNMVGACVCTQGGIVLNFSKMNKIIDIDIDSMTATVQPGVILGDLKKSVEDLGLFYPPDPSNYKVSTIGGSIAQSSGGALAFKYGTTKDYILSLKVVTADGSLIKLGADTKKDSAGYHLAQLMVGSEGTLGIVVEATLKLIPKPEASALVLAYFNDFEKMIMIVRALTVENVFPSTIDFMDKNSIITVDDFTKCGLERGYNSVLLITLDGYNSSISEQVDRTKRALNNIGADLIVVPDEAYMDKIWQARRSSYAASTRLAPDVVSDDIIVPTSNLAKMITACYEISYKYDLNMCIVGHLGDGNLHPQIVLNLENDIEFKNYNNAKSEIYKTVSDLGGKISAEHGIGLEKLSYLEKTIDKNVLNYMKMIKKMFDSNNILNPGKIFNN